MASATDRLKSLEVPVIVELGRRRLRLSDVMNLLPGAIIDLEKNAESELDLLVNNQVVATGTAVKVGENFGLRLSTVGSQADRAAGIMKKGSAFAETSDDDADALAAQFLAGQDF